MMLLLVLDVPAHRLAQTRAHREKRIPLLPFKCALVLRRRPDRSRLLEFAHEVGKAMRGLQPDQRVDRVLDAADLQRHALQSAHGAAQIFVKARAPLRPNERPAFLGGADPVIMQAMVSGTHIRTLLTPRSQAIGFSPQG